MTGPFPSAGYGMGQGFPGGVPVGAEIGIGVPFLFFGDPNVAMAGRGMKFVRCDGSRIIRGKYARLSQQTRGIFTAGLARVSLSATTNGVTEGAAYLSGTGFALGYRTGQSSAIATSADGVTGWSNQAVGANNMSTLLTVGSTVLVGSRDITTASNNLYSTTNLTAFTSRLSAGAGSEFQIFNMATDGTAVILVGYSSAGNGNVWSSATATGAYSRVLNTPTGKQFSGCAAKTGGGGWVATGDDGTIYYSTDRTTWAAASSGVSAHIYLAHYHARSGLFMCWPNGTGVVLVSADNGATWGSYGGGSITASQSFTVGQRNAVVLNSAGHFLFPAAVASSGPETWHVGGENPLEPWVTRQVYSGGAVATKGLALGTSYIVGGNDGGSSAPKAYTLSDNLLTSMRTPALTGGYWMRAA